MKPDTTEKVEWDGYRNGLTRACNMRPTIPFGDEGANVWENIRAQIIAEIQKVEKEHGI